VGNQEKIKTAQPHFWANDRALDHQLIGDPARIGAISGPQTGFVVNFESPDDVQGRAPTVGERAAFERLVRALAAAHERFGARLYSMDAPALNIDDALAQIARAIENR
jgi:hypothetical protein